MTNARAIVRNSPSSNEPLKQILTLDTIQPGISKLDLSVHLRNGGGAEVVYWRGCVIPARSGRVAIISYHVCAVMCFGVQMAG